MMTNVHADGCAAAVVVTNPLLSSNGVALHDGGTRARGPSLASLRAERDALLADKLRLEETVRTQTALLTAAAHDLTNAIAAIRMRADLLRDQFNDSTQPPVGAPAFSLRGGLSRIQSTALRTARLLDELLSLARMQPGHCLDLVREPMDLVALARAVVAEYSDLSEQHGIHLTTTDAELRGMWDPWRLERLLRNLLSNAVKYSPRGGAIRVRLRTEHDDSGAWAVCAVDDHGLGIPASDLDSVFELFHRGANVRGHFAGSGIGLAGALQVAREHGGSLTVDSEERVGSTFTLRLPMPLSVPAAALAPYARPDFI